MTQRLMELLLCIALASAWGLVHASPGWTAAGALAGAMLWSVLDALYARRLLRWLATAETSHSPKLGGIWAELFLRSRKVVKKLERKIQSSNARLDNFLAAIQASPNGVILLDAEGRIEWVNLTAAHQLGFDQQKDVGQYIQNLVRSPIFKTYISTGNFSTEIQIGGIGVRPSVPSKISVQIHPYGHKRKLMLTRDVTAVELADTMRRDFVANVSHEIRTPLTVLSGFVETLQNIPVNETDRNLYLGMMSQQAQRMQMLVSDLLTLSRLEGSPVPGPGDWIDTEELLTPAVQETRALSTVIAETPHEITQVAEIGFYVSCNRSELHSAMSNLLSNAVRYTPAGGSIRTGWRLRADGSAEFFVEDSGPGIAAEHLPRLTERFYRVDRSRSRETGGTGLGLAIVKHVAQRHGGQLEVKSTVGKGSTFSIALPPSRVQQISAASQVLPAFSGSAQDQALQP
jgi:two-component system phosphate regulon sensor histidine kinase PhoR